MELCDSYWLCARMGCPMNLVGRRNLRDSVLLHIPYRRTCAYLASAALKVSKSNKKLASYLGSLLSVRSADAAAYTDKEAVVRSGRRQPR